MQRSSHSKRVQGGGAGEGGKRCRELREGKGGNTSGRKTNLVGEGEKSRLRI